MNTISGALFGVALLTLLGSCRPHAKEVVRVAIGTQDSTINCAAGGLVVRELNLLEKYLPHDGKYADRTYEIEWKNFTSGPPLTSDMVGGKLDIGMMADFPSVLNGVAFQEQGKRSVYVATLSGSTTGTGNGVVVPMDSPVHTFAELKGKTISVPFGSAAHGMLLRAIQDQGWDPEKDVTLVSQSPEVGGTSLKAHKIDAHADFVPFAELFPFRGYARKIYDGATTAHPTSHGVLARGEYADQHPEVIVAFLQAVLEANRLFAAEPEKYSELTQRVSGVEAEVVYMFHGPSGLQTRDPTLKEEFREGLRTAVDTLKLLKRTSQNLDVNGFVDDRFLRQAMAKSGLDYQARLASYAADPFTSPDPKTGEVLGDPKEVGQLWLTGEDHVRAYATLKAAFTALGGFEREGRAVRVVYVHDHASGLVLLGKLASFALGGDGTIEAFLAPSDAEAWARAHGGKPETYDQLRVDLASGALHASER